MRRRGDGSGSPIFGGGTSGNERLTAMTGVTLLVLLAVIGVTIVWIGQLIWLHLFVGLALLGPIAVKLASTGYRFARYYTNNRAYREKGPPPMIMRLIAPGVVVSTIVVFVSGVVLLATGPSGRDRYLLLHKASFIVWVVFTGAHVLGHLAQLPRSLRDPGLGLDEIGRTGALGRWLTIGGAVVGGLVLAIILIPDFAAWTSHTVFHHHG